MKEPVRPREPSHAFYINKGPHERVVVYEDNIYNLYGSSWDSRDQPYAVDDNNIYLSLADIISKAPEGVGASDIFVSVDLDDCFDEHEFEEGDYNYSSNEWHENKVPSGQVMCVKFSYKEPRDPSSRDEYKEAMKAYEREMERYKDRMREYLSVEVDKAEDVVSALKKKIEDL